MKKIASLIILTLLTAQSAEAQRRKKPPVRRPAVREAPKPVGARIIGTTVTVVTKNDDRITGTLLDLTAYSVKLRADNLESVHALDTLASISFGSTAAQGQRNASQPPQPNFVKDAQDVLNLFQSITSKTRTGTDYLEYGGQLTELRRQTERFVSRHSASENATETRLVSLLSAALTDFTWARTIWTFKFSRTGTGLVAENDSPVVGDALEMYPDLRQSAASQDRFLVDKLVAGIWKRAGDKVDRARLLVQ